MGASDTPQIAYRFADHARYLEAAIDALALDDVTLVLHDWGSALGFDWASRHESRVRGLAFMEARPESAGSGWSSRTASSSTYCRRR
jgi:haloalkane dehalogenase